MAGTTLKEFIVRLGFKVDEASFKKMNEQIASVEDKLKSIATVVAATAVAVELNVSRMSDKFFQLSIAAKQARTSVAELQRMEYAGQQVGFAPGQMTEMAKGLRMKLREEPWVAGFLKGKGVAVDVEHPEQTLLSLAEVLKRDYPEGKGAAYLGKIISDTAGVSDENIAQIQGHLEEYRKFSAQEAQRQAIAAKSGLSVEELARRGYEYNQTERGFKQQRDRVMDQSAGQLEPIANKLLGTATDLTTSFSRLNGVVQALLTTLAVGGVFKMLGGLLQGKAISGLARSLFGLGGAAGGAGAAAGAAGAAEGTAAVVGGTEAAVGAGGVALGAGGAGAALGALPPVAFAAALTAGTLYADKKMGLTDKMAAWEKQHDPLVRWYESWKGRSAPGASRAGAAGPGAAPSDENTKALMDMLEGHWLAFQKMWADGINIKTIAGSVPVVSGAGTAPSGREPSILKDALDAAKEAGAAVAHGIGVAGKWTGEKAFALGQAGRAGLEEFRKHGLQAMVERFEGYADKLYPDAGGHSIGYGHFIQPGDNFSGGMTKPMAHALAQKDIARSRATVLAQTKGIKLNEQQVDALTDLVFNVGSLVTKTKDGKMVDRTILKDLKAGNFEQVTKDFMLYTKSRDKTGVLRDNPGLYDRRATESRLFGGALGAENASAANTMNQKTTINVYGVQEPAAVAARLRAEQGRVTNEAMRNLEARTA